MSYFFVIQGIFEAHSRATERKNNEEVWENSHWLSHNKKLNQFLQNDLIIVSVQFRQLEHLNMKYGRDKACLVSNRYALF